MFRFRPLGILKFGNIHMHVDAVPGLNKAINQQRLLLIFAVSILLTVLVCLSLVPRRSHLNECTDERRDESQYVVPNLVHFYRSGSASSHFEWREILCLKAALRIQGRTFIHSDDPYGTMRELERHNLSSNGALTVLPAPSTANLPPPVSILWSYGGIFLANDVYLLRSIHEMRLYPLSRASTSVFEMGSNCCDILAGSSKSVKSLNHLKSSEWVQVPSILLEKDYGALYIADVLTNCSYKAVRLGIR